MSTESKPSVKVAQRCLKCQKLITPQSRAGSLTSFISGGTRCSCESRLPSLVVSETAGDKPVPIEVRQIRPDFDGRFEVLGLLGRGGMGAVWKVRNCADNEILAVKVLRPDFVENVQAVKRFEQEVKAAASVTHTNLAKVNGSGVTKDGSPYLVMDYFDGESLESRLKREGCLSSDTALKILVQISEALTHAHARHIIHRDLKPANIMLVKSDDGSDIVKVVDFGIAKVTEATGVLSGNLTQTGDLFGSPLYMAPEQCLGETVDERSDIYAMGCLAYEMLKGNAPFTAANPVKILLKQVQEEPTSLNLVGEDSAHLQGIEQVVMKCLKKKPEERYQSMSDLLNDLQRLQQGQPIGLASETNKINIWQPVLTSLVLLSVSWVTLVWLYKMNFALHTDGLSCFVGILGENSSEHCFRCAL